MKLKTTCLFSKPNFLWLLLLFSTIGFAQQYTGTGTFTKVNSLSELTDGYYVITNESSQNLMTSGRSGTDNGGFFLREVVSLENNNIVDPATANVWKIETQANGKSIYSESINKYVGWSSGNAASIVNNVTNQSTWVFSYADNKFTVNNYATPVRQLSYNNGAPRFAAYDNANQHELQFYKLASPAVTPTLNVTPEQLTNLNYVQGSGPSITQGIEITGSDLSGNLVINSNSANFQISDDGINYYQSITFENYTGTAKTIYVRLRADLNAGNYNSNISVSSNSLNDAITISVNGTVTQNMNSAPVITSTSFSGTFGVPFSEQIEATNNPTLFDVTDGFFPYGLVLNSTTGNFNGIPTTVGSFSATFIASNQHGVSPLQIITFNIAKANQTINLPNLIKTSLDSPIALPQLTNEGNALSYTSSNTNIATIQSNSGISTIIYQGIGEATITATALETNTHNSFSSTFTINFVQAPEITSRTINGYVGNTINEQLIFTPTGSVTTLANGSTLPAGLTLNNSGLISGTPTEAGSFAVQVIALNNNLNSEPATVSFTILNTFVGEGCLTETFNSITSGSNTTSNSSSTFNGNSFFPVANNAYQAGGAVRLGTGSSTGYIESNNLPSISGNVVVTVDVKGWSANEKTLRVTLGNQSQDIDYTAIMTDAFETKTVVFENVPANSKLRISTTYRRAFVGNVEICNNATNKNVCVNSTLADLNATFEDSENISWFASETSNTALAESFELINGIYYMQIGEQVTRTPFNVTLNPVPQAPVMADEIFCGSTFVSNLPQGDAFASYKWYANNEGGNALNSTESISTGTYYVSQTINGCESIDRTEILITVNQIPNAPIVANQTFCGTTIVDALPQGEGAYKWYANINDETSLALSENLTSGTYFVSTTANNCESERTEVTVTINEIPDTPDFEDQVFCGTTTVNALPQGDSFAANKWYANATDETNLALNTNLNSGTYFVSTTINGCESERAEVTVTINEVPAAPTVANQTFCGATIVDSLPQGEGAYKWYANATDDTSLALSANLTSGTYFVSTTANGCESERTEVTITINEIPETPDFEDQVFCGATTVNALPQGDSFASNKWYANATDETSLALNTNLNSGTYFVSTTINGCESERAEVTVTINEIPDAPDFEDQVFCGATTVNALPQGDSFAANKWYANATDETNLALNTNLNSGTYFVSTTINGCESERAEVTVTINEIPVAPIVEDQTFCGATIVDALPQGEGAYKWYANINDETNLALSTNLTSGTYFVSTTANNCESERTEVTITINEIPETPDFEDQVFCGATTVNALPQGDSFAANKWYANATDETNLALNTNLNSGTYFVSTTINGCESERAEVTVTINEIPVAPIVEGQTFCGTTIVDTLPNGNGTYKWYANINAETNLALSANLNSGTYYVSTTVNGCESERTAVSITINEIPNAPIVNAQSFCGTTIVDALPNGNGTYKWYANINDEINLALSTNLSTGTYYVSATANGCESERTAVSITINEIPNAPIVNAQSFCGATIVDTLPNGNGTYKWYANINDDVNLALSTNLNTGTYYVSTTVNGCESERTAVSITINEIPAAPIVADQTFCAHTLVDALPQGNGAYKWYANATSNSNLALSTTLVSGTYYVSTSANGCESDRTPVLVTIINIPNVNVSTVQTFCGSATVSNLVATGLPGSEILWFNSLTATTPLGSDTALTNGTTYYVLQKINECSSERKSVFVQITTLAAPVVNPFVFCESATVADLIIISQSGVTHKWYSSASSSVPLALNTQLSTGTYYVSRLQNGCESLRSSVQVTIEDIPNSPTGDAVQTFAEGSTINHLIVQPTTAVWYITAEDASTGTNPLSPNMPLVQGGTYYAVNIGTNGCPSLPLEVTVTLTLSNDSFVKNNLRYYPNPVVDAFTIENIETIEQVSIYNALGQHLYSNKYNESKIQIDFSSFASGTYMIKVKTLHGEAYLKVVKQ